MSRIFSVETRETASDTVVSYFTSDRRRARRYARDSGVKFRVLGGEKQDCYGGGPRPQTQIADAILASAEGDLSAPERVQ